MSKKIKNKFRYTSGNFVLAQKSFAVKRYFVICKKRQKHVPYKVILYCPNLPFLHSSQKISFHHDFFMLAQNVLKYMQKNYFEFFDIW